MERGSRQLHRPIFACSLNGVFAALDVEAARLLAVLYAYGPLLLRWNLLNFDSYPILVEAEARGVQIHNAGER